MEEQTQALRNDSETVSDLEVFRSLPVENIGGQESPNEPILDNLVWMNSAEAAKYLRKSVGALRVMVCRGHIRARKFHRRLFFRRLELDRQLDSSELKGGI